MVVADTPGTPALLRSRRFLPLFVTQLLGALNDNLFKNALVVLTIFQAGTHGPALVAAAGGVFILPYALFSALAGQLADRFDRARLIRIVKLVELGLMAVAAIGFLAGSLALLFAVLFGLGVQATFFGPLKYAILPDHLAPAELVGGNALIEAGTFAGILAGTIAGGALVLLPGGSALVSGAGVLLALGGIAVAWRVPPAPAGAPGLHIGWNIAAETASLLRQARADPVLWRAILCLSWFWALGAVFLSEFPVLVRDRFAANGQVVTLLLSMFVLGIGLGSWLAARLLRGAIAVWPLPFAALALSAFAADFAWACFGATPQTGWHNPAAMLADPWAWRALLDLLLVAISGGVFSVPLYALLQHRAPAALRARTVAASNVMNALFMVAAAAILIGLTLAGLSAPAILAVAAALNLPAAALARTLGAPQRMSGAAVLHPRHNRTLPR